jgi:signal transduction histidine kinase
MDDLHDIDRRLQFLSLDGAGQVALEDVAPFLEQHLPEALDALYAKIRAFPETRGLFADEAQLERAREAQFRHWRLLGSSAFGADYVEAARQVGQAHARIGLDPRWYISGYGVVLEVLVRRAMEATGGGLSPGGLEALIKAAILDMELIVSVYLETAEHRRQAAEDGAREALAELARAARVVSVAAFASSIAHEVNQPIAAIVTNGHAALRWLAKETADVEAARETIERIIRDANRTSAIVVRTRGMLTKTLSERHPFSINPLVREALQFTHTQQKRAAITVETSLTAGLRILGDPVQIQQVIMNLIANAIDAMAASPHHRRVLRISTEPLADGDVQVSVADSGIGIDRADAEQIFSHLYTTKSGGMGLGLSVSKAIVEAHGGSIDFLDNTPSGAVFTFRLPRVDAASTPTKRNVSDE